MTLHYVINHVTTVTCLFIVNKKKEKEIQTKNIKSRKIDKRKRKISVLICIITIRNHKEIIRIQDSKNK